MEAEQAFAMTMRMAAWYDRFYRSLLKLAGL
jgi:hypothetical protein